MIDNDLHEVAEQIRHTGREEFVERVNVARESRHDASYRIAIVVSNFLTLELPVEFFPHVEHHVLSGTVEEDRLKV
jgi:hypothetical protein